MLDCEIARLSSKLRDAIVLCYLEGLTNEQAARQLAIPVGTVVSRLHRARETLRGRLRRRGLGVPAAAVATVLAAEAAHGALPAALVLTTVRWADLLAAGQAGSIAAPVLTLTEGVLRAMFISKLKTFAAIIVGIGLLGVGTGRLLPGSDAAAEGQSRPAEAEKKKEASEERSSAAPAEQDNAEQKLAAALTEVRRKEAVLRRAQADLELARVELARTQEQIQHLRKSPKQQPTPTLSDMRAQPVKAVPAAGIGFQSADTLELIQLGTAYFDALRDTQIAKAKAASRPISTEDLQVREAELQAANRKSLLLRSIIEQAVESATADLAQLQRLNAHSPGAAARQNQLRVLRLILDTAK